MVAQDTIFSTLYDKFMVASDIVGATVFIVFFYFIWRYRDGIEEDRSKSLWGIEPGTFPLMTDNHDRDFKLEIAFYIVPLMIVGYLIFLAMVSTAQVWGDIPEGDDAFEVQVNGYQWYWEFIYGDELTWEDTGTGVDVEWNYENSTLMVHAHGLNPDHAELFVDGNLVDEMTFMDGMAMMEASFDAGTHYEIHVNEIVNEEEHRLHTWEHIPEGHIFRTPSEALVLPCSTNNDEGVVFTMHSKPITEEDPRYVGVQHALWLPEWGVKEDLVPGLEQGTVMYVYPDDAGTFPIRCAEYCGLQHSVMTGEVKIVAREGGEACDVTDIQIQKKDTNSNNDDSSTGGGH